MTGNKKKASRRRTAPWPKLVLVLSAVVALASAGTVPAAAAASSLSSSSVAGADNLRGVACSSATTCLAVGHGPSSGLVVPITSGVPGPAVQVAGSYALRSVACPTDTTCVAVGSSTSTGEGVAVLVVNGVPTAPAPVPGTYTLHGVACPTDTTCVAVGTNTSTSTGVVVPLAISGGALTVGTSPVDIGTGLNAVSCPDATDCVAAGVTSTSGAFVPLTIGAGSPPAVSAGTVSPAGPAVLRGIACTNASTCLGAGYVDTGISGTAGVIVPYTSATAGAAQPVSGTSLLNAVACPTTTSCTVVGASSPVGTAVATTVTLPGTAGPVVSDASVLRFYAVACPGPASCVAVGPGSSGGIVATVPGPAPSGPPGPATVVPGAEGLAGVACPTSTICLGAGSGPPTDALGSVAQVVDGFAYPAEAVAGTTALYAVACLDVFTCIAVGQGASEGAVVALSPSPDGTPTAGPPLSVAGASSLNAVACEPGSSTCLAAGVSTASPTEGVVVPLILQQGSGTTTVTVGTAVDVSGTAGLNGLACPSSSTACLAVGTTTSGTGGVLPVVVVDETAIAGTVIDVPGTSTLNAVACPASGATTCLAAGQAVSGGAGIGALLPVSISVVTATTGDVVDVSGTSNLYGLACPGTTSCEAVGRNGSEGVVAPIGLSSATATPGAVATVAGTDLLSGLACASATTCEASGYYSYSGFLASQSGLFAPAPLDDDLSIGPVSNITTTATGPDGAVVTYAAPSVADPDASTVPSATCTPSSGSPFPVGTTTVTCSATSTDDTPSTVTTSFTVTVDAIVPEAPTLGTPVPGNAQVKLSWAAPSFDGGSPVTGYEAFVATTSGAEDYSATPACTTTSATSCTVTGLANGTTYYFTVEAQTSGSSSTRAVDIMTHASGR